MKRLIESFDCIRLYSLFAGIDSKNLQKLTKNTVFNFLCSKCIQNGKSLHNMTYRCQPVIKIISEFLALRKVLRYLELTVYEKTSKLMLCFDENFSSEKSSVRIKIFLEICSWSRWQSLRWTYTTIDVFFVVLVTNRCLASKYKLLITLVV